MDFTSNCESSMTSITTSQLRNWAHYITPLESKPVIVCNCYNIEIGFVETDKY